MKPAPDTNPPISSDAVVQFIADLRLVVSKETTGGQRDEALKWLDSIERYLKEQEKRIASQVELLQASTSLTQDLTNALRASQLPGRPDGSE